MKKGNRITSLLMTVFVLCTIYITFNSINTVFATENKIIQESEVASSNQITEVQQQVRTEKDKTNVGKREIYAERERMLDRLEEVKNQAKIEKTEKQDVNDIKNETTATTSNMISYTNITYDPINLPFDESSSIGQTNDGSKYIIDPFESDVYAKGYSIALQKGESIKIQVDADFFSDVTILGSLTGGYDDIVAIGADLHFYTAEETKTYYILMSGYEASDVGNYTIQVNKFIPPELDYKDLAYKSINLPYEESTSIGQTNDDSKYLIDPFDSDVYAKGYSIALQKGESIKIQVDADFFSDVTILGSLTGGYDDIVEIGADFGFYTAEETKTYYILMSGFQASDIGNYTIKVNKFIPPELDYTDLTYKSINPPCEENSSIGQINDGSKYIINPWGVDTYAKGYSVSLEKGQTIRIEEDSNFNSELTFLGSLTGDYSDIVYNDDYYSYTAKETKTYYILMAGWQASDIGNYNIKVTKDSYTVTYNSQGGNAILNTNAQYDATVSKPTDPTRSGYTFGGWYKEVNCTNLWNFSTDKITSDTTLYAKWIANMYSGVNYQTHVQDVGWQDWKNNGQMSGTSGKSLRLEGIHIQLKDLPTGTGIKYTTHVEKEGWQTWKQNGEMSGTSGKGLRLEGIKIELVNAPEGYHIKYRVHVQDYGWQEWKIDGEMSGTSGQSKRLEGIEIIIVKEKNLGVTYQTHVQEEGWQGWRYDGAMSGTSGKSYRLEGINIKLTDAPTGMSIKYSTHIEKEGWQAWKTNGEMSGTSGKALRLEGIKIQLEGAPVGYHIEYRVHVQDYGWQAWKRDGEMAGTSGESKRLEGIEIRVIKG